MREAPNVNVAELTGPLTGYFSSGEFRAVSDARACRLKRNDVLLLAVETARGCSTATVGLAKKQTCDVSALAGEVDHLRVRCAVFGARCPWTWRAPAR